MWHNVMDCTAFVGDTELSLRAHDSFHMATCANLITGTWSFDADSVYLHISTNEWRIDSFERQGFNGIWPEVPKKPYAYEIHDQRLQRIDWVLIDNDTCQSWDILVRKD